MANFKVCKCNTGYEIDESGRVRNIATNRFLYQETLKDGKKAVVMAFGNLTQVVLIEELMAEAFPYIAFNK